MTGQELAPRPLLKVIQGAITAVRTALIAFSALSADQLKEAVKTVVAVLVALTTLLASSMQKRQKARPAKRVGDPSQLLPVLPGAADSSSRAALNRLGAVLIKVGLPCGAHVKRGA